MDPSIVVSRFENTLQRSRSKDWDYLPGVVRGSALIASGTSEQRLNLYALNRGGLSNKNYLSNITSSAGIMSSDQSFSVEGIKFTLSCTTASYTAHLNTKEVREILTQATFTLFVDGKPKTEGWLLSLAVPTVVYGYGSGGAAVADVNMNTIAYKNIAHNPIGLPPGVSFDVEVILTCPVDTGGDTYITCELIGTRKIRLG